MGHCNFGIEFDGPLILDESFALFLLTFQSEGQVEVNEGSFLMLGQGFAVVSDGSVKFTLFGVMIADLGKDFGVGIGVGERSFVGLGKGESGLQKAGIDEFADQTIHGMTSSLADPSAREGKG